MNGDWAEGETALPWLDARRFIPNEQFKLATAYNVPAISGLRVGAGINWQSKIYYGDT